MNYIHKNSKAISGIVIFLFTAGAVYFCFKVFMPDFNGRESVNLTVSQENFTVLKNTGPVIKDKDYYLSGIAGKKIFLNSSEKTKTPSNSDVSYEFAENLKLKGIIRGNFQKAVIEDTLTGKTYIVSIGEKFNEAELIEIKADTVIVNYLDKNFRLQL